ncbi:MAG: hypothetical protein P4L36_07430 [Holophaga sp.]|nr:hypothetical protein [Holophaga sp.]
MKAQLSFLIASWSLFGLVCLGLTLSCIYSGAEHAGVGSAARTP